MRTGKKLKKEICFIILHFGDEKLTERAVNSLLRLNVINDCMIIIVENGSPNNSGNYLKTKYEADDRIHVIISKENLGFSCGNNLGYQYIKNNYDPKFIIAMNNDILFLQKDFIEKLHSAYLSMPFHVGGPDVFVPQRFWHSSPLRTRIMNEQELAQYRKNWESGLERFQKGVSFRTLKSYVLDQLRDSLLMKQIYHIWRKVHGQKGDYVSHQVGCVLQGSCLIVDKRFINETDKLFFPETFLYEEENILTLRCMENGWIIRYLPELQVYHTCQGSTHRKRQSYKQYCEKRIKEFHYLIKATDFYAQYFNDYNNRNHSAKRC